MTHDIDGLTDSEIQEALDDFAALTTTNCEWTHYGALDQAVDALKIERRRRENRLRWDKVAEHEAAIKELRAEINAR